MFGVHLDHLPELTWTGDRLGVNPGLTLTDSGLSWVQPEPLAPQAAEMPFPPSLPPTPAASLGPSPLTAVKGDPSPT